MKRPQLILLPALLGIDGVWLAVPVAEVFAAMLAAGLLFGFRRRYGYWPVHADQLEQVREPEQVGKLEQVGKPRHGTAVSVD